MAFVILHVGLTGDSGHPWAPRERVSPQAAAAGSALGLLLEGAKGPKAPAPSVAVSYGYFRFSHDSCDPGAHVQGDAQTGFALSCWLLLQCHT